MKQTCETRTSRSEPGFDHAVRACLVSGVLLIDVEKGIATLTPEANEILGFPKNQGPERLLAALPPTLVQMANRVLVSNKPASEENVALGSSGETDLISVSAVPIKSGACASIAVLTLHKLNTGGEFVARIRQLDRLANAGTLAAGMAHEIKNALVAGRTFLDLLLEKNSDEELVQIVRRETGRIDAIVSRMLRFAATNAGAFSRLHVHEVLEHALRLVQPQMSTQTVSLERSFRAGKDAVRGDEYELHQGFVNLLLNALEAMAEGGTVTVSTDIKPRDEKQIEIRITDTGAGILPEHIDRLFEPFFTTKAAGTGLGLPVTKRIIQEHGGSISVNSRPGQGTSFSVMLPLL